MASFQKAVDAKPNYDKAFVGMASAYNQKSDFQNGLISAKKALAIKAKNGAASFYAGEASKELGQKTKALAFFTQAARDRRWKQAANYEIKMIKEGN